MPSFDIFHLHPSILWQRKATKNNFMQRFDTSIPRVVGWPFSVLFPSAHGIWL
jgi:hypothetical protein